MHTSAGCSSVVWILSKQVLGQFVFGRLAEDKKICSFSSCWQISSLYSLLLTLSVSPAAAYSYPTDISTLVWNLFALCWSHQARDHLIFGNRMPRQMNLNYSSAKTTLWDPFLRFVFLSVLHGSLWKVYCISPAETRNWVRKDNVSLASASLL